MFKVGLVTLPMIFLLAEVSQGKEPPRRLSVTQTGDYVDIKTDSLEARIKKKGYVSGVAQGSFLDKKTGAKDWVSVFRLWTFS
jgi:hypothetical protein